jgi:hypothetical protein
MTPPASTPPRGSRAERPRPTRTRMSCGRLAGRIPVTTCEASALNSTPTSVGSATAGVWSSAALSASIAARSLRRQVPDLSWIVAAGAGRPARIAVGQRARGSTSEMNVRRPATARTRSSPLYRCKGRARPGGLPPAPPRGRIDQDSGRLRLAQRAGIKTVARSASRSFRSPTLNKSPKSANCSLKTQIPPQSSGGPSRRPPVQRG